MVQLTIDNRTFFCDSQETVLNALLRENVNISYACQRGTCHSCLIRSLTGRPPEEAQAGLKATQKTHQYFLACLCRPEQDMALQLPDQSAFYTEGKVIEHRLLNRNTLLLVLAVRDAYEFNAGQFVNLQRSDGLTRSYSIADIPRGANTLEFHIRCLPEGRFSRWLHHEVTVGDSISVSEPRGHCFYLPDRKDQGLLMVGTGTGLAPLAGILTDALAQGHSGPIHLYHGGREAEDLYRIDEMRRLAEQYHNFHYFPCVSGGPVSEGFIAGRAGDIALSHHADLKGWRIFLCGHPDMVQQMKIQTFLKGASSADIYTDAFVNAIG